LRTTPRGSAGSTELREASQLGWRQRIARGEQRTHLRLPAALSNPDNPISRPIIPAMQAAAASLSLIVEVIRAPSARFSLAFAAMAKSRVDSVVVTEDGEFAASFRALATLALANKLPSIGAREYAALTR
jgi:ABC-type uncharacterized transport system substrate-binding protein